METIRALVEGFLRGRYGVWSATLASLGLPVLIGAILVVGWLLMPTLTIPRFTTEGTVVRDGAAVVVACGKKRGLLEATKYAPEPATGGWWPVREGECTVWYHRPPGFEQRQNRQERAAEEGVRRSPSEFQRLPVVEKAPVNDA